MPTPDKILVDYGIQLDEFRKDLDEIKKGFKGTEKTAKDTADNTSKEFDKLGTNVSGKLTSAFKQLGTAIAAAFTIRAIVNFTTQCINLAREAEEVTAVFNKLNNPALLGELRKAVDGTVADIKLMQLAIKASNFKIPLKDLADAFSFAKLKADETGRSTEELAATIIDSIGRNSTRALVELGISQKEISEKVKETGSLYKALNAIITETVNNVEGDFDSASDKVDRLNAQLTNTKIKIGTELLPAFSNFLKVILRSVQGVDALLQKIGFLDDTHENLNKNAKEQLEIFKSEFDEFGKYAITQSYIVNKHIQAAADIRLKELVKINDQIAELQKNIDILNANPNNNPFQITKFQKEIDALNEKATEQRDTFKKLEQAIQAYAKDAANAGVNVESLGDELSFTNEELKEQEKVITAIGGIFPDLTEAIHEAARDRLDVETDVNNSILQQNEELARIRIQNAKDVAEAERDAANEIMSSSHSAVSKQLEDAQLYLDFVSNTLSMINARWSMSTDYQISLLEKQLEYGKITQDQFDQESAKYHRKEALRAKQLAEFEIIVNTARAIIEALPNPVAVVLATITGATQLGIVESEPIPQFKNGGFPKGKNAIVQVNEEGQEFIVNAKATRQYTEALKAMNKGKFEQYIKNTYKSDQSMTWDDYRLQLAIYKLGNIQREVGGSIVQAIKEHRKPHRY